MVLLIEAARPVPGVRHGTPYTIHESPGGLFALAARSQAHSMAFTNRALDPKP